MKYFSFKSIAEKYTLEIFVTEFVICTLPIALERFCVL